MLVLMACYYDKADVVAPVSPTTVNPTVNTCKTDSVTYAQSVAPIIMQSCVSCHGSTYKIDGQSIKLDTYSDLKSYIGTSGSVFLNSINRTGSASPMPKAAGKLGTCELSKISAWINKGMPQ